MQIGKEYRVVSDGDNVMLQKRAVKTDLSKYAGEEYWLILGYFSRPNGALHELVDHELRGTEMTDLKTVCAKLDELHALIDGMKLK